jgi:hypothetical protein
MHHLVIQLWDDDFHNRNLVALRCFKKEKEVTEGNNGGLADDEMCRALNLD